MLWREVELKLVEQSPSFCWREMFVEGVRLVRVEIIEHHPDAVGIRVVLINQCLHLSDELLFPASLRDLNVSPSSEWFAHHEEISCPVAFVGVVVPSDRSRARRERVAEVLVKSLVGFVKTDDWATMIVGFVVEIENILHLANESRTVLRCDHPGF